MIPATVYMIALTLAMNTVPVTPQEWVRSYVDRGGKAMVNEKDEWLGVAILDGNGRDVSPAGILYPKGATEVRLGGAGIRNSHVSAVLKWPGVQRLYLNDCKGIDDTVFPIIKAAGLQELHMYDMPVTASGVSGLSGSKSLQIVNLVTTLEDKYTDLKLTEMAQLRIITLLNFGVTSVVMSDMPKLESIFDTKDLVGKKPLLRAEFSRLPKLSSVDFVWAPLDKLVIEDCKSLEEVRIAKGKLTDAEIAALMRANPKLKIVRK